MQKANSPRREWRSVVSGGIALLIVILDQLSKWWIRSHLAVGETLFDLGFLRVIHIYNTGAAFGILKDQTLLLAIIAFVGVLILLVLGFIWRHRWPFLNSWMVMSAIGLVMGGTIGNLTDRLANSGRVVDFIDFKVWPAFNVADMAIDIGVLLIVYRLIRMAGRSEAKE
jgi:signal peptidase II